MKPDEITKILEANYGVAGNASAHLKYQNLDARYRQQKRSTNSVR